MNSIITISREVGSEGHTIGKKLAKELGIPLYDKYFIYETAKTTGIKADLIEDRGEYLYGFEKYFSGRYYNGLYLGDDQDQMFQIQRKIILEHAKKGPCVFVGRCADAILAEEDVASLNVFIHADMDFRIATYLRRYPDLSAKQAEKIILKKDKGRAGYYRFYTEREWGKVEFYDVMLDSSRLGVDACTDIIIKAAEAFEKVKNSK